MKFMSILTVILLLAILPASVSAQYFTKNKAEHDSLAKVFAEKMEALMQKDPELAQLIIVGMQVSGDNILARGHRTEYVSMPGKFKKQVYKRVMARIDTINLRAIEEDTKIYSEINQLGEGVEHIDNRLTLTETAIGGEDEKVKQAALSKIKELVKSRRTAAVSFDHEAFHKTGK